MELAGNPAPEFGMANPNAAGRGGQGGRGGCGGQGGFDRNAWFKTEGVAGMLSTAPRGHGIYTIGGNRATDPANAIPQIVIPAEQYGRIARMVAKNIPVTIEADIKNTYTPNPPMFNVVGEIPGTDKADEVVMLGAHFDSWHASTGATDNAAGSAAMMEAMRILKQSGVKLRRTVRIGPVDRRGAGPDRIARLREGALRQLQRSGAAVGRARWRRRRRRRAAPAAPGAGARRAAAAPSGAAAAAAAARPATRSRRSTRSSPATSTSTTAPARSAACTSRRTTPWRRSSASGWSRSAASA